MKTYKCMVCGWIYDEVTGSPKEGIEPGTKWDDVPEDWVCPDCGVTKDQFEMVEI
ncbi:MAG TPA: rubredoxin [Candidatus Thioglobus sp.]|jgi:rubredoxin|nr:rubredoxin [Candidatus Thioglobus sp.]HIB30706.1 rubredoxin [Candidatus Thioglobus sp.]HIB97108.1 rubredoxin [Candidatus Thioglobus sp.]